MSERFRDYFDRNGISNVMSCTKIFPKNAKTNAHRERIFTRFKLHYHRSFLCSWRKISNAQVSICYFTKVYFVFHESNIIIESKYLRFLKIIFTKLSNKINKNSFKNRIFWYAASRFIQFQKYYYFLRLLKMHKDLRRSLCIRVENNFTSQSRKSSKSLPLRFRPKSIYQVWRAISRHDASEGYIVAYLLSVSEKTSSIQQLLSHFKNKIKEIIHSVLANTSHNESTMRFVLEECYKQSLDYSGSLNSDRYFDSLDKSFLESPYDPDFEPEQYYDHENRLAVDEDYAAAEYVRKERKYDKMMQDRDCTSMTWLRVLGASASRLREWGDNILIVSRTTVQRHRPFRFSEISLSSIRQQ